MRSLKDIGDTGASWITEAELAAVIALAERSEQYREALRHIADGRPGVYAAAQSFARAVLAGESVPALEPDNTP